MIFGNQAPKFQVSAVDVLLDYAVIERDETDKKSIVHESELNRARSIITKPEHHEFVVLIHLHRYADPTAKFDEIVAHLNSKVVRLWRHRDGAPFRDDTAAKSADFWFESYQELYITTSDYTDGLRLVFRSIDIIDHTFHADNWTFDRQLTSGVSNAVFVNPVSGLVVAAANTVLSRRLVAGKFRNTGILLEPASTTLINRSVGTTTANAWGHETITHVEATTKTLDPEGGSLADIITANAANQGMKFNTSLAFLTKNATCSAWVKANPPGTDGEVECKLQVESTTAGVQTTIDFTATAHEWREFQVTHKTSGSVGGNLQYRIAIDNSGDSIFVFDNQMEQSTYKTHILKTTGSNLTKAREDFTIGSSNTRLTKLQGTISFYFKPNFEMSKLVATHTLIEAGDSAGASDDLFLRVFLDGSVGDRLGFIVFQDNNADAGISVVPALATGLTVENYHNIVVTWDAKISNGGHIFVDGVELGTGSVNGTRNLSEIGDTIRLGSKLDASEYASGVYDELFIDDLVWSAGEVLERFNSGSLSRTLI